MLYKQNTIYQNISGVGRDCNSRWDFIKKYISKGKDIISVDVGSAEGFFVKKLTESTNRKVIPIEGSDYVYNIQKKFITGDNVIIYNLSLDTSNINIVGNNIDNLLLLSVLHWFEDPDYILQYLSNISKHIFIELPNLNCTQSYNQPYLKRIRDNYGTLEEYISKITGKNIIACETVDANHVNGKRNIYYIS